MQHGQHLINPAEALMLGLFHDEIQSLYGMCGGMMGKRQVQENNLTINIAIGVVFGVIVGIAIDHIPLGISLGMLLGAGIGSLPWRNENADSDDT